MTGRTNLSSVSPLWSTDEHAYPLVESSSFVLCEDESPGGGEDFPWTLLLINCLKMKQRVVLLSTGHARDHYEQLLRRSGLDCATLEKEGRLQIRCMHTTASSAHVLTFCPAQEPFLCSFEEAQSWLQSLATSTQQQPPPPTPSSSATSLLPPGPDLCLFIDDLECLELLAPSAKGARMLMAAAFAALGHGHLGTVACFGRGVTSRSGSASTESDSEASPDYSTQRAFLQFSVLGAPDPPLTAFCRARAHVVVSCRQLASGASSEAQGLLDVDYISNVDDVATPSIKTQTHTVNINKKVWPAERYTYKVTASDSVTITSRR